MEPKLLNFWETGVCGICVTGTALSEWRRSLIVLTKMDTANTRLENRFLFSDKKLHFQPFSTQRLH